MGMIQIRNVPGELHRTLKARAAADGVSLSDYVLRLARQDVQKPTLKEMLERLRALPPVDTATDPVDIIREYRDRP